MGPKRCFVVEGSVVQQAVQGHSEAFATELPSLAFSPPFPAVLFLLVSNSLSSSFPESIVTWGSPVTERMGGQHGWTVLVFQGLGGKWSPQEAGRQSPLSDSEVGEDALPSDLNTRSFVQLSPALPVINMHAMLLLWLSHSRYLTMKLTESLTTITTHMPQHMIVAYSIRNLGLSHVESCS